MIKHSVILIVASSCLDLVRNGHSIKKHIVITTLNFFSAREAESRLSLKKNDIRHNDNIIYIDLIMFITSFRYI